MDLRNEAPFAALGLLAPLTSENKVGDSFSFILTSIEPILKSSIGNKVKAILNLSQLEK